MTSKRTAPSGLLPGLGFAAFLAGFAFYAWMASHSAVWRADLESRDKKLRTLAAATQVDLAAEGELARAYWMRYPDVRADAFFGEGGRLGVLGAREHFNRHGRREGRIWGN
jgi:hypothetical protein